MQNSKDVLKILKDAGLITEIDFIDGNSYNISLQKAFELGVAQAKQKIEELEKQNLEYSWMTNPERMGQ